MPAGFEQGGAPAGPPGGGWTAQRPLDPGYGPLLGGGVWRLGLPRHILTERALPSPGTGDGTKTRETFQRAPVCGRT